jgi:hypothetical protein
LPTWKIIWLLESYQLIWVRVLIILFRWPNPFCMQYYICYASFSHFEGFSKVYISIHHEFAPGMYNWHFCNDFVINSAQFDVYEDLTYGFLATGRNRDLILHLVPHLTLCSTLDLARDPTLHLACDPTLGAHWSWQVGTLATFDGRIKDLGFVPPRALQLQSSTHLGLGSCSDR